MKTTKLFKSISCFIILLGFTHNSNASDPGGLTAKEKSIVTISALTAKGDLENLENALVEGLDAGLTVNEIKEVMVHLYAYCGFPRSLRGLQTFIKVLDERKAKGIEDNMGTEASPIEDTHTKYDRGKANLEALVQRKLDGPPTDYAEFAPIIEVFLKEHLFADIFERDVLNYQQRELVTVSVLITIGDLEPMLRSHMNICLIQGITPTQLKELVVIVGKNVDQAKIESAKEVLNELLESKK
ncbi:carboxymuconolactone decarboxylase family protein [Maribacter sp. TH_r10]|uniref:carboxymuconolactone decarboxylase family protein n=1 Tax=Maribacter sp. TH_r10 TaxID=3082086 RepID=UPI002952C9CF|nr:carboxymuconolactone decarboxylase family protein [Maribacter sp. TH_r10]MDV7137247.1 carboxymuconolactone decarboxylase family protein [Maribacter sp. TH_r10]